MMSSPLPNPPRKKKIGRSMTSFGPKVAGISPHQKKFIRQAYRVLLKEYGPQKWWPARTKFEVMVGAILTQNTNWGNVEKAIKNLSVANALSPRAIDQLSCRQLAELIRPSGFFNVKSKRLKAFVGYFVEKYAGSVRKMAACSLPVLREELLSVSGVGKETADSILLYALDKPVFVVDAYTKRILVAHNVVSSLAEYDDIQNLFMGTLKTDVQVFNEYHALIVRVAKDFYRKNSDPKDSFLFQI